MGADQGNRNRVHSACEGAPIGIRYTAGEEAGPSVQHDRLGPFKKNQKTFASLIFFLRFEK